MPRRDVVRVLVVGDGECRDSPALSLDIGIWGVAELTMTFTTPPLLSLLLGLGLNRWSRQEHDHHQSDQGKLRSECTYRIAPSLSLPSVPVSELWAGCVRL